MPGFTSSLTTLLQKPKAQSSISSYGSGTLGNTDNYNLDLNVGNIGQSWNDSYGGSFGGLHQNQTFGGFDGSSATGIGGGIGTNATQTFTPEAKLKPKNTKNPNQAANMNAAAGVIGGLGEIGGMVSDAVFANKRTEDWTNTYGVTNHDFDTDAKQGQVNDAINGAMQGMQVGATFGPIGMAAGLVVGGVGNWLLNKNKHLEEAKEGKLQYTRETSYGKAQNMKNRYAQEFASLMGQRGMKLAIQDKLTKTDSLVKLQNGGKVGYDTNVIPSGKLHKENNNIGNKDKGIPVVDTEGQKLFEIEKDELILHLEATKVVESMVYAYNESNDDQILLKLGEYLTDQLINNTEHVSDKYQENES